MTATGGSGKHGWTLVAGLLLVMTVCHGTITSALPTLDKVLLADLGISRGDLKLREAIFLMSSGLAGLGIGFLTRYVAPAWIVLASLALLSLTLFAYAHASSIGQIYCLYVLLGLCFAGSHVVIVVLMIRERFDTRRAFATSVALSGTSIGASIFPPITVLALDHVDWRHLLTILAVVPLLIMPIAAFLIRKRYGAEPAASDTRGSPAAPVEERTRTRTGVILLMVATFGTFFGSTAFLLNMFLYLQDIGLSSHTAAGGVSTLFLVGLVGKVLVGLAAERWGIHRVWTWQQFLLLVGALLLTLGSPMLALAGLVLLGWGWAGCYVLTQVVIADYFAGPRLGQMTGAFIVFEAVGSGSGVWAAGALFDRFGSYRPGFFFCCVLIVVALAAGIIFRRHAGRIAAATKARLATVAC